MTSPLIAWVDALVERSARGADRRANIIRGILKDWPQDESETLAIRSSSLTAEPRAEREANDAD
jgi:hypothetical protein